MLRVALVGAGWVSAHHLAGWQSIPAVEVVAICDRDIGRAHGRALEFGIRGVFDDVGRMLGGTPADVVDVATSPADHGAVCIAALAAGRAVICQKPLAPTLAEAEAIAQAARDRGRMMIHENWRHRPHYVQMKRWLAAGAIGRLRRMRIEVRSSGLLRDAAGRFPAIARQPLLATLPRLMIAEVLVHHLDVAQWLAGAVPLRVVRARIQRTSPAVRGEDTAAIELAGDDGTAVELFGTMTDPTAGAVPMDAVLLDGDRGTLRLEGSRLSVTGGRCDLRLFDLAAGYQESYSSTLRAFVGALARGQRFPTEVDDHLVVLRRVEDAYRAAVGSPRTSGALAP